MNDDKTVWLGMATLLVVWLAPLIAAAFIFRRKGYSPHWTWFGIVPFVGLIVLVIAIFLGPRAKSVEMSSQAVEPQGSIAATNAYRKGMKELGRGLIVLDVVQSLIMAIPSLPAADRSVLAILAAMDIILGVFAVRLHIWVNYVVGILALAFVIITSVRMALASQIPRDKRDMESSFICFSLIIPAALLYYAVNNLQKYKRVQASLRHQPQEQL